MMKFSVAASMVALALLAPTASADVYKGRIKWVAVSPGCTGGPNQGDRDNAVFHEYKNVAGEKFTALNVFWSYGGDGKRINANVGTTMTDVDDASSVGANPFNALGNPNVVIKFNIETKVKSNGTIVMGGYIQNPWGDETFNACTVEYLFTGLGS